MAAKQEEENEQFEWTQLPRRVGKPTLKERKARGDARMVHVVQTHTETKHTGGPSKRRLGPGARDTPRARHMIAHGERKERKRSWVALLLVCG